MYAVYYLQRDRSSSNKFVYKIKDKSYSFKKLTEFDSSAELVKAGLIQDRSRSPILLNLREALKVSKPISFEFVEFFLTKILKSSKISSLQIFSGIDEKEFKKIYSLKYSTILSSFNEDALAKDVDLQRLFQQQLFNEIVTSLNMIDKFILIVEEI